MISLYEQYRPKEWQHVIGQDKAIKKVKAIGKRGLAGKAFWITGKSGTGKSTIAYLIAQEVASVFGIVETTGREVTVNFLRDWLSSCQYVPMQGESYCLIVNESHGLSKPAIELLLNILEQMAKGKVNACIVFTTTCDGDSLFEENLDAGPFASRVIDIALAQRGLAEVFAKKVHEIADKEGLNGLPESDYVKLANKHKSNFRRMLQAVESGEMIA